MNTPKPPLVAHIIYALGTGGLENGLVNIINRAPPGRYRHAIICLTSASEFASRVTADDVAIFELNKAPGHDWGVYWRLLKVLYRLRPAIIHTRNLAALEMQAIGLLVPGARAVHGEHGRDIYDLDGSNRRYQMLRRLLSPLIRRFITVSQDLRNWLVDSVGIDASKVVQIYNGVDSGRFVPEARSRRELAPAGFLDDASVVIGTVGRLAEVKNQLSLVEAFARLVDDAPERRATLRLLLVGDGPLRDTLRAAVSDKGIEDLVWMPGDRSDVPDLLAMMDVFVLPSLAEGISNTVLEAMASGLPVVATNTGGNPELVSDDINGYLVPVNDSAALASRLQLMLDDLERTRALGAQGREIVHQTFNWDRTVDRYLSVYDEVLTAK